MKNLKQTSVSKLVARFDKELMNLLNEDLKAIKAAKNQIVKKMSPERLSAA
jgi:hypothetical protein